MFWVFEECDGCEIGEVYLVTEAVLLFVAVDGEGIWSQDEEDGFPVLKNRTKSVFKDVKGLGMTGIESLGMKGSLRTFRFCVRFWT